MDTVDFKKYNLNDYVEKCRSELLPPVSNKLMYGCGQLKVMIVGGPNKRKDYHIEEGEELFVQLIGDMDLDIVERDMKRKIVILKGNMLVLPSRIPHSPQRYANTIGLVFERERLPHEQDGLRWYVSKSTTNEVLYEEYFHCTDLGTQLAPVISRFFELDCYQTDTPPENMPVASPPISVDTDTTVSSPFPLYKRATTSFPTSITSLIDNNDNNNNNLEKSETVTCNENDLPNCPSSTTTTTTTKTMERIILVDSREFRVECIRGVQYDYKIEVPIGVEIFLWQLRNTSQIKIIRHGVEKEVVELSSCNQAQSQDVTISLYESDVILLPYLDNLKDILLTTDNEESNIMILFNKISKLSP